MRFTADEPSVERARSHVDRHGPSHHEGHGATGAHSDSGEGYADPATGAWPAGAPIEGGTLYRLETWLGQVREVERRWFWGKDRWLALRITDGREEHGSPAGAGAIVAPETAIRKAMEAGSMDLSTAGPRELLTPHSAGSAGVFARQGARHSGASQPSMT